MTINKREHTHGSRSYDAHERSATGRVRVHDLVTQTEKGGHRPPVRQAPFVDIGGYGILADWVTPCSMIFIV